MEYALVGKFIVEAVAASAVLLAALRFLKDRRASRADELGDRAAERAALLKLVDNAIAHNTAAIEANTREQHGAAEEGLERKMGHVLLLDEDPNRALRTGEALIESLTPAKGLVA